MHFSPTIAQLIEGLRFLPGVGPKSAQRMALHILERNREAGLNLANQLQQAIENVQHCRHCRTLTETPICQLCNHPNRQSHQLCIVESPADIYAIEQTACFQGLYFVLHGHLSPIDGIGPADIGIEQLQARCQQGLIDEIILATNPTAEGEATAHYIAEIAKSFNIQTSRIAHGVPVGSELEYVNGSTLAQALTGRKAY